jgi:thiamine-monophosphate kinase
MGGIPKYILVSLAIPNDLDVNFIEEIYKGIWSVCEKYNIEIIGGNMTHCDTIVISITMIGEVDKNNLCLRSGAKPEDLIFVSGHLGNGRAGLRLFQENVDGFNKIRKNYLEPKSQLDFSKKISQYVNSIIDVSDGLASEIKHICNESNCGAIIFKDKIPIDEDIRILAKKLNEDEYDYALYGGEDFQLLYTVSKENLEKIDGFLIGEITKDNKILLSLKGKEEKLVNNGYDHFRI